MLKLFLKENLLLLIIITVASCLLFLFSAVTVFNYSCDMEEEYIRGCNSEIVQEISNSVSYGKTIKNHNKLPELADKAAELIGEECIIIINDADGQPAAHNGEGETVEIKTPAYRCVSIEILDKNGKHAGSFDTWYNSLALISEMKADLIRSAVLSLLVLVAAIAVFSLLMINVVCSRNRAIIVLIVGIVLQGIVSTANYSMIFADATEKNIQVVADYLATSIEEMQEKGVELDDICNLDEYFESEAQKYKWISSISIVPEDQAVDSATVINSELENNSLCIEFSIDKNYIRMKVIGLMLAFFATVILGVIIMIETLSLPDQLTFRKLRLFNTACSLQYETAAQTLRLTNFMTSTFSYMCLSFAALQIKEWNRGCLGMSASMSSALAVSLCTLAEAAGMILVPVFFGKVSRKKLMVASTLILALSNIACFFTKSVLLLIIFRILSGFGFAGNKQVNNQFITVCYETDEEKQKNLSESNAGIIGGILCGMGLGSVIANMFGYGATFICAGMGFFLYLAVTLYMTPWKLLEGQTKEADDTLATLKKLGRVVSSPAIWKAMLTVVTPQYIFLMVIITLIPGRIQSAELSGNLLTYCNLINGICGLYIGSKVGSFLIKKLGRAKSLSLIFAAGIISMFMIDLPLPMLMLLISAVLAGLIDGAGTPLATDMFLENRVLKHEADDETGLMLYSIAGFVVMSAAPVILELCEKNYFVMIGSCAVLALAAIMVFFEKEAQ